MTEATLRDGTFPLLDILRDSLYYPASGLHGAPVQHLAGCVISFVYVDYGYGRDRIESDLESPGFKGYECIGTLAVSDRQLIPGGWIFESPLVRRYDGVPIGKENPGWDGEPIVVPFCLWAVFQRTSEFSSDHGPFRFSFLYICGDAVQVFHKLYLDNAIAPKAVAIIQPGHGPGGGNWTNFEDENDIFADSVLNNPEGQPELLLFGGSVKDLNRNPYLRARFREPCWPTYYRRPCIHEWEPISRKAYFRSHGRCQELVDNPIWFVDYSDGYWTQSSVWLTHSETVHA